MFARRITRIIVGAAALVMPLTVTQVAAAPTASAISVRTVTYDTSGAQEFKAAVDEGAQAWNAAVKNVKLVPASGGQANIKVLADDGWPHANPAGLGKGSIVMGRQAVKDGFYPPRIAAHELGHILGLADNRNGRCDYLMSGHSSPTSCKTTKPSPSEIAEVERNFRNGLLARPATAEIAEDCFQAPATV